MPTPRDLVGRQAELAQLSSMLTDDVVPAVPAVVVSGEPGVGKTALIEQMSARAAADGWQVVRVLGVAAEQPFALGGLNQLVFGLKAYQAELDDADRAVLAPVFGGDPDSEVAVLPLASGLLNLVALAGQHQPLLLVVDDVHWLDVVSAEVLGAVGRRLTHPRVRIVAGLRTSPESVFSGAGWGELPLAPLGAGDSLRLLESAGVPVPAARRTAILDAAQGNPLALVELPRFGDRIEERLGSMPLTERLVAVFGAQLGELDAGVRAELLRAALDGVAGGVPSSTGARFAIRNVAPAVKAGLLVVNPFGDVVFRHPLVRAAVIHQADPQERRDAHRDLAGLYDEVLVRRAAHLAAATTEPDQQVADVLARAAALSVRRGGLSVGVEWLRRAAELSTDPDRRAALFADAVFVAARADQPGAAGDLLGSAGTAGKDSALAVLADCYRAFHADGEVISTHRRILDVLTEADDLDDKTVNRLVYLLVSITNYADSAPVRSRTNDTLLALQARLDPAVLMYRTGVDDFAGTATTVRTLLRGYLDVLPQAPAQRVVLLSFPAYCVGMMADFRAPLQSAFAQLREHGASVDAIECGRVVLMDLIASGQWEQAEQVGAACLEMAEQIECSQLRRQQLLTDLALLAAGRGDVQTARRYAAETTAWSKPRRLHRLLTSAVRVEARAALAEADYEAAYRAAITLSRRGTRAAGEAESDAAGAAESDAAGAALYTGHHEAGEDMFDAVEAALHTGRLGDARALAADAVELNLAAISPRSAALTAAMSAMTAPDAQAGGLFEVALAQPGLAEFPFEHARIQLAQGMWLRRARRHTEARGVLGRAAECFSVLGARPWAERARAEMRAAGPSVKQSLGETAPLSAQERRIADLAAAGDSSKEIAVRLSLSPRTVDGHLYRVFRKLGIGRRAGLSKALRAYDAETLSGSTEPS